MISLASSKSDSQIQLKVRIWLAANAFECIQHLQNSTAIAIATATASLSSRLRLRLRLRQVARSLQQQRQQHPNWGLVACMRLNLDATAGNLQTNNNNILLWSAGSSKSIANKRVYIAIQANGCSFLCLSIRNFVANNETNPTFGSQAIQLMSSLWPLVVCVCLSVYLCVVGGHLYRKKFFFCCCIILTTKTIIITHTQMLHVFFFSLQILATIRNNHNVTT